MTMQIRVEHLSKTFVLHQQYGTRLPVMKQGEVVESGLTDRVLDDPHHPYTQLLVSSVLS